MIDGTNEQVFSDVEVLEAPTNVSLTTVVDDYSDTWEKNLVLIIEDENGENERVHLSILNNVINAVEREVFKHLNSPVMTEARQSNDWDAISDSLNKVVALVINHESNHALMKEVNKSNKAQDKIINSNLI
jgi:RNase P protein component